MNKRTWIIIILLLHVAAAAGLVVVLIVVNDWSPKYDGTYESLQRDAALEAQITDELIVRLEDELKAADSQTRFRAISELAGMAENHAERLGPVLLRAINNEDPSVRFSAANKLGTIKYAPAAPALTNALDDPDQGVSVQAIESLVKLDKAGLQAVMEALAKNRIKNIDAALSAVRRITGRSFPPAERGRRAALDYWAQRNEQGP